MSILFYKKPNYIIKELGPLTKSNCQKYVERAACSRSQIPQELSWENVMEGRTLPPCSISDFLDYLMYVSHDAENLQFWLWLKDYTKRFNALPPASKRLSPKWISGSDSTETIAPEVPLKDDDDTAFDIVGQASYHRAAAENERFGKQPFRREISQISAHYILPGSPRELNLSHKDRSNLLTTLSKTTHPSAFAQVLELTTLTLRNHSHPNFIRWSICNGNKPRVLFLRSFAVFWLTVGCIISLLLILSDKSRWIRIAVALPIWFGTVNIVAAARGLCVLLFRRSTREVHPWEIDAPVTNNSKPKTKGSRNKGSQQLVINIGSRKDKYGPLASPNLNPSDHPNNQPTRSKETKELKKPVFEIDLEALSVLSGRTLDSRLEALGPSNNYTGESWVKRWRGMRWLRKLALRKVWVKEEGLRILQNKIVLQAHLWGVLVTLPFVTAVVACPQVGLY